MIQAAIPILGRALSMAVGRAAAAGGQMQGAKAASGAVQGGMNPEKFKELSLAAGKLSLGLFTLGVAVVKTSSMYLESQRHLSRMNAQIANAFFDLERGRLTRQYGTASYTADSTKGLAEAMNKFEATIQPMKAILTNGLNRLATFGTEVVTQIVAVAEYMPWIGDQIKEAREEMKRRGAEFSEAQWSNVDRMADRSPYGKVRPPLPNLSNDYSGEF